jgi:glycine dehydrogenase subunit 2
LIGSTKAKCKTRPRDERDVNIMKKIREEAMSNPNLLKEAPHTLPVKRLGDVKAARELDLNYYGTCAK